MSRPVLCDVVNSSTRRCEKQLIIGSPFIKFELLIIEEAFLHETADHSTACKMSKVIIIPMTQHTLRFVVNDAPQIEDVSRGRLRGRRRVNVQAVKICNILIKSVESLQTDVHEARKNGMGSGLWGEFGLKEMVNMTRIDEKLHERRF